MAPEPLTDPPKVISCTILGGGRVHTAAGGVAAPWTVVAGRSSFPPGGTALVSVTGGASRSGRPGHPSPVRDAVNLDLNPRLNFPGAADDKARSEKRFLKFKTPNQKKHHLYSKTRFRLNKNLFIMKIHI